MLRFRFGGWKILLTAELLLVIFLFVGCFGQDKPIAFFGEDIWASVAGAENGQAWSSDEMKLTPGIYQVRVRENMSEGQSCYISMEYGFDPFKALQGNGVLLTQGQGNLDFEFYVSHTVSTAYVSCVFYGGTAEMLIELEIYRLSRGSRMALVIAVFFFAVLDCLLVWRKRILEGRVDRKQQLVFFGLVGTVLLAYFPYLTDYVILGDETLFYLKHVEGLVEELSGGGLPLFYGEGFLWLPAGLRIMGFSVMAAYKLFVLAGMAATAVASYFSFKKCIKDNYAALFGAFVYTLNPWYLSAVYNRGDVKELLVTIFLPLIACGIYGLYGEETKDKGYKGNKWYVAIGITAVLLSGIPYIVSVLCGILLVSAGLCRKTLRRATLLQMAETAGMVLVMNCWCWLPMLGMLPDTRESLQGVAWYDIWSLHLIEQLCALAAVLMAMLLGFVYKRFQGTENRRLFGALSLSAVMAVAGIAMYQVNDIAFRSQAVKLYTAESMSPIPDVYKGSPIFYIAQGMSAISILVLLLLRLIRSKKQG